MKKTAKTNKRTAAKPRARSSAELSSSAWVEERHEAYVRRVQWAPGDTYQQVCVQTFKFPDNARVEVVVRLRAAAGSSSTGKVSRRSESERSQHGEQTNGH